jgi:ribonuclease P protein component
VAEKKHAFGRAKRLSGRQAFAAVYARSVHRSRGPLKVYSVPNSLAFCRWGLSVSRRVGTAVRRNRIKRLLREAIRAVQHDMPGAYDVAIVVRGHTPLSVADYQKLLWTLMIQSHGQWATM